MPSFLSFLGGVTMLALGFAADMSLQSKSIDMDLTAPAPLRWVLPTPLKHFRFITLAGERDVYKKLLDQANAQELVCIGALKTQNASIDGLARAGQEAQAALEAELGAPQARARQRVLNHAEAAVKEWQSAPGTNSCQRVNELEAFVRHELEGLR